MNMIDHTITEYLITVSGKVQRVGFRDKVEDLAMNYDIMGYVENRPRKEAFILAQGKKENLDQFCKMVQKLDPPCKVTSIKITEHPCENNYDVFSIVRGDPNEELAERFDNAVFYLHNIDQKQDKMLEKQDKMLEKQDKMLEKQDIMSGKQDIMIDLQKESISLQTNTFNEIHALRNDITDSFMYEVKLARTEIKELRKELVQAGVLHNCESS